MSQTKSIQIRLRVDVPLEKELLDYLAQYGTRSGLPKQWLLSGFKSLKESGSVTPDICENKIEKKPHAMAAFVAKG